MLVITEEKGLYFNYDLNTWHKDIENATIFEDYELDILIELIENQDYKLEIRNEFLDILHTNYAKSDRIDIFLS